MTDPGTVMMAICCVAYYRLARTADARSPASNRPFVVAAACASLAGVFQAAKALVAGDKGRVVFYVGAAAWMAWCAWTLYRSGRPPRRRSRVLARLRSGRLVLAPAGGGTR